VESSLIEKIDEFSGYLRERIEIFKSISKFYSSNRRIAEISQSIEILLGGASNKIEGNVNNSNSLINLEENKNKGNKFDFIKKKVKENVNEDQIIIKDQLIVEPPSKTKSDKDTSKFSFIKSKKLDVEGIIKFI
jgi:hypothetical protein